MKSFLYVGAKGFIFFCLLLLLPESIFAKNFVIYDDILEERTAQKVEEMGVELFAKTGVKVILIVKKSEKEEIVAYEKKFAESLTPPFALLTLFLEEKKVDIYSSAGLEKEFDKEAMLSPLPWKGTIIPLLTTKKREVGVSPALLNGYADLVEQIAAYRKVELESAIGSSNKTTLNIFKILIYGFVAALVLFALIRKRMRKNG